MLPNDPVKAYEALMRWSGGNQDAANFLSEMAQIARLADDIVDEQDHRQRNVAWLLTRCLAHLPNNPFFARHAPSLSPLIVNIIVQWHQSDEYRLSDDPLKQQFGFVMREGVGALVAAVAGIIGGYDFAKEVADDFFQTCHSGSAETVEHWVKE